MPDWNTLPKLIKELYGESIEIDKYEPNGWLVAYYGIYRDKNTSLKSFMALYEKIKEDYEDQTQLRILKDKRFHEYEKITNQNLDNVDRENLRIVIFFGDLFNMEKRVAKNKS